MTRSGSFRFGATPENASSKVFLETPLALASGQRSCSSQARKRSSTFAAEAGAAKQIRNAAKISRRASQFGYAPGIPPSVRQDRGGQEGIAIESTTGACSLSASKRRAR